MKYFYSFKSVLLCIFIFQSIYINAQGYPCEDKLYIAEKLLSKDSISQELLKEISLSVDSCFIKDATSFYVKGMLKLRDSSGIYIKEGFRDVETAALYGHENAAFILGLLYKDGKGCKIDFDKAKYWFEISANMGNNQASYSLGYLYLKGLGTLKQDYDKAIYWFKKSSYPMAKHWLAICEYYGFGISENQPDALNKLKKIKILNSQTVVKAFETNDSLAIKEPNFEETSLIKSDLSHSDFIPITQDQSLTNTFDAHFIEYDWSGKYMLRNLPIEISLDKESEAYKIVFDDQEVNGEALFYENSVSLENAKLEMDKLYSDHPDKRKLTLDLLSITFLKDKISGKENVIGIVDSWIEQWQEPGPPIRLVFNGSQFISEDALKAFANQVDSFIKLYPNPFHDQLLIQYELEEDAQIRASLYDFAGAPITTISNEQLQQKGEQLLNYNGNSLPSGRYVIRLYVNGKVYSKLLLKK